MQSGIGDTHRCPLRSFDRNAIASRLRSLLGEAGEIPFGDIAAKLGVEELSLRLSVDEISPHPTVEVLDAVIRVYGVDPTWLLTGQYDSGSHRMAVEAGNARAILATSSPCARRPFQSRHRSISGRAARIDAGTFGV